LDAAGAPKRVTSEARNPPTTGACAHSAPGHHFKSAHAGAIGLLGATLKKSPACAGLRPLANRKLLASAAGLHFPHIIVVRVADLGERVTERIIRQRLVDVAAGRH
jgi:hypothetical protein